VHRISLANRGQFIQRLSESGDVLQGGLLFMNGTIHVNCARDQQHMRMAGFHHRKLQVQPMRCGCWILVCILLFVSGRASAQTCVQPPSGLISWWAADGDATDLNSLNNGTLQGGASFTSGEVGGAFSFANGTGYVSVPDSPSLNLAGDFTIELWANFTSLTGSRALMAKDNGPGQNNKWIYWLTGGQLQFLIGTGSSSVTLGSGTFSPALNTWHHLAVTRSGSLFSFYMDGTLISTGSSSTPIPTITAPLTIGQAEGGNFMGGLEDEVTIYSRALSLVEIETIYREGSAGKCGTPLAPFFVTQPQPQTMPAGNTASLNALAGGTPPLSYQWQFNGADISTSANPTAATATLALINVQPSQSGSYAVIVSNAAGSTNSASVQLSVMTPGSCSLPSGVVSWWTAEGNALDSVGANEGMLEGGAGFAPGEVGQAFDFRNGTSYVQVPDSPGLDFGANDFSIELWANFTSLTGSRAIIAKDNGPNAQNKWIFWLTGGSCSCLCKPGRPVSAWDQRRSIRH
jgi:Concanavalin A-like lectin/glucanases superfamily/Immunoglobulin I-set domain